MLRKLLLYTTLLLAGAVCVCASPVDEAKKLYRSGDYESALRKFKTLHKSSPKDGTVNYYLGACYVAVGDEAEAISPLKQAESRGVADASRLLAEIAVKEYRVDDADTHIEKWAAQLKKSKKSAPESFDKLRSRIILTRNMLDRVEKIAVIDSIVVDYSTFFKYYRLSSEAGELDDKGCLPENTEVADPGVVYVPENRRIKLWSAPDSAYVFRLMEASFLDDGTMEPPRMLDDILNDGGDANFPFLMSDGVTLYFANNGDNSLGGYDIFLTRRDDDGFLQPQNIGMPYNSPYDDYMLAIDEANGIGWWATDRNRIPGKVTVYVFVTNETRINYDADDARIADYAIISSIADTRNPDVDYDSILSRIDGQSGHDGSDGNPVEFVFPMGNGSVYTSLSDFRKPQARDMMEQLLARRKDFAEMKSQLAGLRARYANGDKSVSANILTLERRVMNAPSHLREISNSVVRLETGK